MTLRPPNWPGGIDNHWRDPRSQKELDDEFIDKVIRLWDQKCDTVEIAAATRQSQANCERALHIGLEKRRAREDLEEAQAQGRNDV